MITIVISNSIISKEQKGFVKRGKELDLLNLFLFWAILKVGIAIKRGRIVGKKVGRTNYFERAKMTRSSVSKRRPTSESIAKL